MAKQSNVENPYVRCPYYKYERQSLICCEGYEGNNIQMTFLTGTKRKEYEKRFCEKDWEDCIIADANNRKWGYEV